MLQNNSPFCPTCGRANDHSEGYQRPGIRRVPNQVYSTQRNYLAMGDVADLGAMVYEHIRPSREANVASDVVVPLLQSAVTGVLGCIASAVPVVAFDLHLLIIPAAGALAFGLMWVSLLADHRRHLWETDRYERQPEPMPEAPPTQTTRLSVKLENKQHEATFPIAPDTLLKLAKVCNNGVRSFSERELAGHGKLLSGRAEFERVRGVLFDMGWLRWKTEADRRQGVEWTLPGRAGLRVLATGRATAEELLS